MKKMQRQYKNKTGVDAITLQLLEYIKLDNALSPAGRVPSLIDGCLFSSKLD